MRSSATFVIICLLTVIFVESAETEFMKGLYKLTNSIVSEYFRKFKCVSYVTDDRHEKMPPLIDEKPIFLVALSDVEESDKKILTESFEQACAGYVIRVQNESRSSVVRSLIDARTKAIGQRYNNQRYLFLPSDENDRSTELLEDPQMLLMPNLNILTTVVDRSGSFDIVSHTLFNHHRHNVLGITQEVVDSWSSEKGFAAGSDLYPEKVKNVYGRKFVFAAVNYSPFSLIIKEGNDTVFDGYETRIAAQFVETINGSWEGLDHPVTLWGELYPNGTGNGIVGSVKAYDADFGYGAMYQWFCDDFDCSYPIYQSLVTCLVPRPKLVSGWLTIILPFLPNTWIALIIGYFINTSVVLFILTSLRHLKGLQTSNKMIVSDSFFTVMRLQLEQIPKIPKSKEPLGLYINICVYYYFFVAAFWQGGIASILTVPRYEDPIDEGTDLVERWPKINWGANSRAWLNSIKDSTEPLMMEIVNKFVVQPDEILKGRAKKGDFGFFIEKLPHGHYGFNDYIDEDSMHYLRLMKSGLYSAFGVLISPRGSAFSERLDHTLLWMFDTGLIHKFEVQVSLDRINNRLQNMINEYAENDDITAILAIRHVEGAIFIYFSGMSIAFLVFLFEKFVLRASKTQR